MLGIRISDAALTEAARVRGAGVHPRRGRLTTRWDNVRPALRFGDLTGHRLGRGRIVVVGAGVQSPLGCDWRTSLLWGAVLSSHRRRRGVLACCAASGSSRGCPRALELESGLNDAPVVIAVVLLARGTEITWLDPLLVVYESGRGAVVGRAGLGFAGAWLLRREALPRRAVPAGRHRADRRPPTRSGSCRARVRVPGHLRRRRHPRQLPAAAPGVHAARSPRGSAGWRRSACSSCSGSTSSRAAACRAVCPAIVIGLVLLLVARPLSVLAAAPRSGCPGGSRRSCPGRGCAARCPSCWPPSRC